MDIITTVFTTVYTISNEIIIALNRKTHELNFLHSLCEHSTHHSDCSESYSLHLELFTKTYDVMLRP